MSSAAKIPSSGAVVVGNEVRVVETNGGEEVRRRYSTTRVIVSGVANASQVSLQ